MSACTDCSSWNSRVLESRRRPETGWQYRRRECVDCGTRWATYEVPAQDVLVDDSTKEATSAG